jgi:homoserine kinase type II
MSNCEGLCEQELVAVLSGYDLGVLKDLAHIEQGYVNEKWLLETGKGLYLLKRRHPSLRKPSLVQAQHSLVQYLRSADFPAPALVATRNGHTFLVRGGELYEVQEYVPGAPYCVGRVGQLLAAGHTLGLYHKAVAGFDHRILHWPMERYGPLAFAQIVIKLQESWGRRVGSELASLFAELRRHAQDLQSLFADFGQLPELVIHGDYHGANLVFQGNQIAAVVDYDLAHWCSRAMEVAEAVIAFCTSPGLGLKHIVYQGVLDLELVMGFLAAYQREAPLSETEIQAFPEMIRTIWLCAALDPPLEPHLSLEAAPGALPEILALADWAAEAREELVEICLAARMKSGQ